MNLRTGLFSLTAGLTIFKKNIKVATIPAEATIAVKLPVAYAYIASATALAVPKAIQEIHIF